MMNEPTQVKVGTKVKARHQWRKSWPGIWTVVEKDSRQVTVLSNRGNVLYFGIRGFDRYWEPAGK